jgi:hypothetical protein
MDRRRLWRRPAAIAVALFFPLTVLGFPALMSHASFDEPPASVLAWAIYIALFGFSVNAACRHIYDPGPEAEGADREVQRLLALRRHRGRYSVLAASVGLTVCAVALLQGDRGLPGLGVISIAYTIMLMLAWLAVSLAASDRAVHEALARRGEAEPAAAQRDSAAASRASASIAAQSPATTRSLGATQLPPTQRTLARAR